MRKRVARNRIKSLSQKEHTANSKPFFIRYCLIENILQFDIQIIMTADIIPNAYPLLETCIMMKLPSKHMVSHHQNFSPRVNCDVSLTQIT
jgi:hypothetical protein